MYCMHRRQMLYCADTNHFLTHRWLLHWQMHLFCELQDEVLLAFASVLQGQAVHVPTPAGFLPQTHNLGFPGGHRLLQTPTLLLKILHADLCRDDGSPQSLAQLCAAGCRHTVSHPHMGIK